MKENGTAPSGTEVSANPIDITLAANAWRQHYGDASDGVLSTLRYMLGQHVTYRNGTIEELVDAIHILASAESKKGFKTQKVRMGYLFGVLRGIVGDRAKKQTLPWRHERAIELLFHWERVAHGQPEHFNHTVVVRWLEKHSPEHIRDSMDRCGSSWIQLRAILNPK